MYSRVMHRLCTVTEQLYLEVREGRYHGYIFRGTSAGGATYYGMPEMEGVNHFMARSPMWVQMCDIMVAVVRETLPLEVLTW